MLEQTVSVATRRTTTALAATLVLAAACWVLAVRGMSGMDLGVDTQLGSFGFFIGAWVPMMAAMMLPGAVPTVVRRGRADGRVNAVLSFLGTYLAVWTLVGLVVYWLYRPHGTVVTGVVVIAAGLYEFTPLKKRCRRLCRETVRSGAFAMCCVGSSIGLMAVLVVVGVMSVAWMAVVAAVVVAQKLLPARRATDVFVALAIIALGVLVVAAPSALPGLVPSMSSM